MEKRLQRLETFSALGSDGKTYSVHAYEHLCRVDLTAEEHWEPTGQIEYKLADGRPLKVAADGSMSVPESDIRLTH